MNKTSKLGIFVTKNAWKKMSDIMTTSKNNLGFMYSVSSGGCNGFNFELDLLNKDNHNNITKNKPLVLKNNQTTLYIDPFSEMYLLGSTIDYIKEDYSKNIFENKFVFNIDSDLASSCGCGVSFTPKNLKNLD